MIELINLQQQCLSLIESHSGCSQSCALNHYCTKSGCTTGDCSRCLNQIQYGSPNFTYSCTKITYQYVLRFFNRFASEIIYRLFCFNFSKLPDLNVVSLGCGPGTEVYGIIKTLLLKNSNTILHYEGHDINNNWETVQEISKRCLGQLHHEINFYTTDLFTDFHGFAENKIHILVLNYLLSDAALFLSSTQKQRLMDDITNFILENNVKNVFFNDINYYGDVDGLNSGTQLMRLLIQILRKHNKQLKIFYTCFPNDPKRGNEDWKFYTQNKLLLQKHPNNPYMKNVEYCNSKQIFIHIK